MCVNENARTSAYVTSHRHASSSSSSCGLSGVERSRSHESTPCLTVLGSSIGGCQTNVEWCKVRLHRPEPCMTGSAGRTIPVSWQRGQTAGPKGSTVIHGWISTGNMAKKLETTFRSQTNKQMELNAISQLGIANKCDRCLLTTLVQQAMQSPASVRPFVSTLSSEPTDR